MAGRHVTTTDASECDCKLQAASPEVCSTSAMVEVLADFLVADAGGRRPAQASTKTGAAAATPEKVVAAAAAELGCSTEACVVSHPRLSDFLLATEGPAAVSVLKKQALLQFKTPGPREGQTLLSNFDIDGCLERWAAEYPEFFNCPFAMIDFDREPYLFGRLNLADVPLGQAPQRVFNPQAPERPAEVRRPATLFGCVLNTDVSSGKGKHWVCVCADFRGADLWTIEFFNSSGNPPPRAVVRWMERQATNLRAASDRGQLERRAVETRVVTTLTHQRGDTECGVYALYYLRARLEGTPSEAFARNRVSDKEMAAFRKHLFSNLKF